MVIKNMRKSTLHLKVQGFTLIELLIVTSIMAILGALAFGSYSSSVQKSRRVCGTSALLSIATLQEKNFFQFNQYSNDVTDLYGSNQCPEGHYQLAITFSVSGGACSDDNNCFTATATAIGSQLEDENCRVFSMDNLGVKQATNAGGDDNTEQCW